MTAPHQTADREPVADGLPAVSRREFMHLLGAGLVVSVCIPEAAAQRAGGGLPVSARIHIGEDGTVTVMSGKVEIGQGARAQLSQAAAEELRVPVARVRAILGDTALTPDDGITAGSRTTPSTVPAVRRGAAAARELLVAAAAARWQVEADALSVRDGVVVHPDGRTATYAEIVATEEAAAAFKGPVPDDIRVRSVREWEILGTSVPRPNARDLVTGAHAFPSDMRRPGMLYGCVLRPLAFGATLKEIDLEAAKRVPDATVVRDGDFIGCVAPAQASARRALAELVRAASWRRVPQPSARELTAHLRENAADGGGRGGQNRGSVETALNDAETVVSATYEISYVQHAPMEPRAALAEWSDGRVTVWTGSQAPFRVHGEVARALGVPSENVRVVIPDAGGGFGGKHSGEAAVEAARLARAAGRPVLVRWTREEEFTWAYFRPAAVIDIRGGLDAAGAVTAWDYTTINPGSAGLDCPYAIANCRSRSVGSRGPLREGSYRCLAATANNFARESFVDELAAAAGRDPLEFRLAHLREPRLRRVLEAAAEPFGWPKARSTAPGTGVGIACGTEKGSVVATCVEVCVDRETGAISVSRICEAFECGAIQNPANLWAQVSGCILMGLGPALREEISFRNGRILNPSFRDYAVPRFHDVPELDIRLVNLPDSESVGGGETPIIAVAPAIANAVYAATGIRVRTMPLRGDALRGA